VDPKKVSSGNGSMHGEANPLGGGPLTRESSSAEDVTHDDHPLALSNTSKWNTFFKDNEIKEQIDRDVMRTHPDMHFFSGETPAAEQHRAVRGGARLALGGMLCCCAAWLGSTWPGLAWGCACGQRPVHGTAVSCQCICQHHCWGAIRKQSSHEHSPLPSPLPPAPLSCRSSSACCSSTPSSTPGCATSRA
jgi:hypothetical protein